MRHSELRRRLAEALGDQRSESFAQDHVLTRLDNRTVDQALAAGWDAQDVWLAVWEEMALPRGLR